MRPHVGRNGGFLFECDGRPFKSDHRAFELDDDETRLVDDMLELGHRVPVPVPHRLALVEASICKFPL
jgi:hypothetical protein